MGVWLLGGFIKNIHELGVRKYIPETSGHIIEAFGEVNLGLTMLHPGGSHGILFVAEQVVTING